MDRVITLKNSDGTETELAAEPTMFEARQLEHGPLQVTIGYAADGEHGEDHEHDERTCGATHGSADAAAIAAAWPGETHVTITETATNVPQDPQAPQVPEEPKEPQDGEHGPQAPGEDTPETPQTPAEDDGSTTGGETTDGGTTDPQDGEETPGSSDDGGVDVPPMPMPTPQGKTLFEGVVTAVGSCEKGRRLVAVSDDSEGDGGTETGGDEEQPQDGETGQAG